MVNVFVCNPHPISSSLQIVHSPCSSRPGLPVCWDSLEQLFSYLQRKILQNNGIPHFCRNFQGHVLPPPLNGVACVAHVSHTGPRLGTIGRTGLSNFWSFYLLFPDFLILDHSCLAFSTSRFPYFLFRAPVSRVFLPPAPRFSHSGPQSPGYFYLPLQDFSILGHSCQAFSTSHSKIFPFRAAVAWHFLPPPPRFPHSRPQSQKIPQSDCQETARPTKGFLFSHLSGTKMAFSHGPCCAKIF